VRELAGLLNHAPEMPAAAEFVVRRCIDRRLQAINGACFYITLYVYGYGEDEEAARARWAIALKVLQHAMMQQCAKIGSRS
jgi:hypothetical protein